MGKRDSRVDTYIAKSADFARPVLTYIRDVVHEACPDVEEDLKWRVPAFMYKGMMCGMASFKQYAAFVFWKASLVGAGNDADAMERIGRLTKIEDLPPRKTLLGFVKKAAELNDAGVKVDRGPKAPRKPIRVPPDLAAALKKGKQAKAKFDAFSPSHKREYVEWITGAKTDETRDRRIAQAVVWIGQGKSRNWKYERKA